MTTERRGGPRVPDGRPRPQPLPASPGPNRTDMAELPGTPGTPLPPNPMEPQLQYGETGRYKRALAGLPTDRANPQRVNLLGPSQAPNEPITAGLSMGPGAGPDSLIPSPDQLNSRMTAEELRYAYPLIMRLAALPNATTETKIIAQRLRANLSVKPEQVPPLSSGAPYGIQ